MNGNDNRISTIKRIGHPDTGGGHAGDRELSRFPFQSLEDQAQERLRILVTELSPAPSDHKNGQDPILQEESK